MENAHRFNRERIHLSRAESQTFENGAQSYQCGQRKPCENGIVEGGWTIFGENTVKIHRFDKKRNINKHMCILF